MAAVIPNPKTLHGQDQSVRASRNAHNYNRTGIQQTCLLAGPARTAVNHSVMIACHLPQERRQGSLTAITAGMLKH